MFNKFLSLGWFCGTASSMSKYGLRSNAGPFDWCFTELAEMMELIDTDFEHFMEKSNLEVDKDNPKTFRDTKYKISYFHDVKEDLETDYENIYGRYSRRIEKFREFHRMQKPVCYIRAVHNEAEMQYILSHEEYISGVIKKYNPKHEIVFLYPESFSKPKKSKFKFFELRIDKYSGSDTDHLKELFDTNKDFIHWCYANSSLKGRFANLYWEAKKAIINKRKSKKVNE